MTVYQQKMVDKMKKHHPCTVAETDKGKVYIVSHNLKKKEDLHYEMSAKGRIALIEVKVKG